MRERAGGDDVVYSLWVLVAKVAFVVGLQSVASPPVGGPVSSFDGEPKKDLYPEWSPSLPDPQATVHWVRGHEESPIG